MLCQFKKFRQRFHLIYYLIEWIIVFHMDVLGMQTVGEDHLVNVVFL
ncbi:predicted protein [Histoplasma mississippiense (nom. inval.)]|nr:predicted protein [Histoplasma mississippiense (nom. inval.)]EDN04956.1 predicted protein [Histoplasma mississippiense (nom. inval.)]